jgi:hypothetical protein
VTGSTSPETVGSVASELASGKVVVVPAVTLDAATGLEVVVVLAVVAVVTGAVVLDVLVVVVGPDLEIGTDADVVVVVGRGLFVYDPDEEIAQGRQDMSGREPAHCEAREIYREGVTT